MTSTISKTIVCILSLQFCVCTTLHAAPSDKVNSFAIGPSLSQITYKEPGYMEDKGVMYGLSTSYRWHGDALGPIGMIKVESEATWGLLIIHPIVPALLKVSLIPCLKPDYFWVQIFPVKVRRCLRPMQD